MFFAVRAKANLEASYLHLICYKRGTSSLKERNQALQAAGTLPTLTITVWTLTTMPCDTMMQHQTNTVKGSRRCTSVCTHTCCYHDAAACSLC
jgi:hypothetical protein